MLASPHSTARSSMEVMLDSLRRTDEGENQNDLPPALPSRPTSKARLPKRLLHSKFALENSAPPKPTTNKKQNVNNSSGGGFNFGRKKVKADASGGESPYTMTPVCEQRVAENGGATIATQPETESDDSIGYFIKNKLGVWCKSRNNQWELAKIKSTVGEEASVMLLDGSVIIVSRGEILPANTEILNGVDDLVELGYLNEPSVLHNLQHRYDRDVIYSKAGPILLAINPYKEVNIFGNDFVAAYKEKILDNPHVYSIADIAYSDMMKYGGNQSIIISGENGSGKTETAKFAIKYLASIGGKNCVLTSKILHASCILEAFGNAKTSCNLNSSRFGELINIHYNVEGTISSASIQTFLLEKSRVSQVPHGERSYHIFYQICAGAPSSLKDILNLKTASEYTFLNQSGCLKIDGVDDAHNFLILTEALDTLGISLQDQENIFELLAAILWLGNISFAVIEEDEHIEVVNDEASQSAARLMGCNIEDLMLILSTNGSHDIAVPLRLQQANNKRYAVANFIYESMFNWIVGEINTSLEGLGDKQHTQRIISITDICGFESFQKNSFHQLFINYTDERLQHHFIRHLCKLQQEEYELDGIHWKKVEFKDNQECLNLFEKKPMGLISILNECSSSNKATDVTFTNKIKQHLSSNSCFTTEKGLFQVHHYANEVEYDPTGFLQFNSNNYNNNNNNNNNFLLSDTIEILSSSSNKIFNSFSFLDSHEQSVGTKFKDELFKLIQKLENTKQHYIRCIRPNNKQIPGTYEKDIVLKQLKCNQVMEIVQLFKSRYPICLTHQEFSNRFRCLLSENIICMDPLSTSVAILKQHRVPPQTYQVGYTKLFFQQIDVLENLRQQVLEGTHEVKDSFLGGQVLLDFHELKFGILTLQSFIRGENARREYNVLKKSNHGLTDEHMATIVQIQSVVRGWLTRRYYSHMQRWKKSTLDTSKSNQRSCSRNSEMKGLSQENVEELQKRVMKAESTVSERQRENTALREQIKQLEKRSLEYETKMKSVEEMWQSQMGSLQMSLAVAKKTLGSDGPHLRPDNSPSTTNYYDSEDDISGLQTPVQMTPARIRNNHRETNGVISNTVDNLSKEFEQRKQIFDNDAKAFANVNPKQIEDYRNLKKKFEMWKKEYKYRLREAKTRIVKGVEAESGGGGGGDRRSRNWWGKLSKRGKERIV